MNDWTLKVCHRKLAHMRHTVAAFPTTGLWSASSTPVAGASFLRVAFTNGSTCSAANVERRLCAPKSLPWSEKKSGADDADEDCGDYQDRLILGVAIPLSFFCTGVDF